MTAAKVQPARLPAPRVIDGPEALDQLRHVLRRSSRVAVDTESNSLYAYREQVCLIQLSTDQDDYLIDPLALIGEHDLDLLGECFADSRVEKVFHAAEYDVMCLRRDYGFEFHSLFDTMIAARILGWSKIGLGAILEQEFGVVVNKGHQRADWGQRPLPPNLIRYAQTDTHYLLTLRDRLHKELEEAGRLEEAREAFAEVCRAEWSESSFNPEHFWRINGAAQLPPRARAVLRELYIWREREAERRDLPLFKVASDQLLLRLAQEMPRSHNDLRHQIGLTETQLRRHAAGVLRSIQLGLKAPIPKAPPRRNSYNHVVQRYEALHAWRKERAAQRGVESDVIMPKDALWELAEVAPRTMEQLAALRSLGPWKRRAYGAELLAVLTELDGQVTGTTRK